MKRSLLQAFCQKNLRPLLGLSLLELCSGLLILVACYFLTQVVDGVFLQGWDLPQAAPALLVLLFVLSMRELLHPLASRLHRSLSATSRAAVRHGLHVAMLSPSVRDTAATSQRYLTLALETTDALDDAFTKVLPNVIRLAIRTPLLLVALIVTDWPTGLLALLTLPIAPFLLYLIGAVTKDRSRAAWQTLRELSAGFGELIQTIPVLKLFHQTENQRQRLARMSREFADSSLRVLQLAFLSSFALELITTLAIALIAVGVGLRLLYGHIAFAPAFFVLLLAPEFYAPLREAGAGFHAGMTAYTAWQELASFLAAQGSDQQNGHHASLRVPPAIHLKDIRYRYPGAESDALAPLTCTIPAGQITAITGPSGCGKTTLLRLLAGLTQPTAGAIYLEDQPLATMAPDSRKKLISYVPQEPHLYDGTLRENLLPPCATTDALCLNAVRQAGLTDWYATLPGGLDTRLGEGGATLSNGQRHRLGLARALLQGRPIVLLDEPTAGLDTETERSILRTLRAFSYRRTVILITHRPAALALADQTITLTPPPTPHSQLSSLNSPSTPHSQLPTLNSPSTPHSQLSTLNSPSVPHSLLSFLVPASFLILLLVSLLSTTTGIGLLGAAAWLIASAALHPPLYTLTLGITAVRACGIGRAAFRYGERYLTHRAAFAIQTQLHLRLYDHAARLLPLRRGPARQGELLHRLLTGTATLRDFYLRGLLPPLTTGIFSIIGTILLWPYLSLPALLLPTCWLIHLLPLATRQTSPAALHTQAQSAALYRSTILDFTAGCDELQTAGHAVQAVSGLDHRASKWQFFADRQKHRRNLQDTAMALLRQFTLVLFTAALIPSVEDGRMTGITLAVFLLLLESLFGAFAALPTAARQSRDAKSASANIFYTPESTSLSASSRPPSPNSPTPNSQLSTLNASLLSVHRLSFGYNPHHPILNGLSFSVSPGQHTAIIGESGAGKTTLAQLLAGVWPPDSGTIMRTCPIALLPQGSHVFSASIRTNFTYLYPGISDKKILSALQDAQLDASSDTIDRYLGENACRLSGGQRTRLITSLTLASDAPLLLLDEPTNGLDAAAAEAMLTAIFSRVRATGQTLILITHDERSLSFCQQVISL